MEPLGRFEEGAPVPLVICVDGVASVPPMANPLDDHHCPVEAEGILNPARVFRERSKT
jgi:hypothetical protein